MNYQQFMRTMNFLKCKSAFKVYYMTDINKYIGIGRIIYTGHSQ